MRIAPRTLLCGTAWRVSASVADTGFDELRDLAAAAGDTVSLAIGMTGLLMTQALHDRPRELSRLASEYTGLLESIGDPTLMSCRIGRDALSHNLRTRLVGIDFTPVGNADANAGHRGSR